MYQRIKDNTNLLARMKLPILYKQYLHVYIWKTNEAMRLNYDFVGGYAAAYCGVTFTKRKFGEIHLVKDEFGGGIFAHELQHFVLHWLHEYGLPDNNYDKEQICLMVGNMTNKFWTWFYKNNMDGRGN